MKLKNKAYKDIDTIIFDYGNVLIDIDISLTINAFKQLGLDKFDPAQIHPNNAGVFLELEMGKISTEKFVETIKLIASEDNRHQISSQMVLDAWNELLLPFDFKRFEMLEKLRPNYRIMLLSNTNKPHHDFLEVKFAKENPARKPFGHYFDHIFYSDELQLRKPEAKIYSKVAKIAQLTPETTLFIDDNAPNLDEPRKMGWQTHHLKAPQTVLDLFE